MCIYIYMSTPLDIYIYIYTFESYTLDLAGCFFASQKLYIYIHI